MNFNESYQIEETFKSQGYNVKLDCSKSSDYVILTKENDKYNFDFTIRFSDHDAMTQASKCADLSYVISDLKDEWDGMFDSKISIDEDGDISCDEVSFETEQERDDYLIKVIIAEVSSKIHF